MLASITIAEVSALVALIGTLAFLASVITECTKNIRLLKGIPTDAQVIVTAVLLALGGLFAWANAMQTQLQFWMIIAAVIGGILASFVAMYGWATLMDLYERFRLPEKDEE